MGLVESTAVCKYCDQQLNETHDTIVCFRQTAINLNKEYGVEFAAMSKQLGVLKNAQCEICGLWLGSPEDRHNTDECAERVSVLWRDSTRRSIARQGTTS